MRCLLAAEVGRRLPYPTESVLMSELYNALAGDYDWLFSDDDMRHGVAINLPATARLLSTLSPGSAVLDAACGTGVDAGVLARRGYRVSAADASAAMVSKARMRFAREGLAVTVLRAEWARLPAMTTERFDAVLCIGNSLIHAPSRERMIDALQGLAGVLRTGGDLSLIRATGRSCIGNGERSSCMTARLFAKAGAAS